MAAVTAAAIGAAGALGAAKMSSDASKKAMNAQTAGANAGIDEQRRQFDTFQQNINPYLESGQNALAGLTALNSGDYSGFNQSPDYLWAQQQGLQGLDRSAAARGSVNSGGHQADLLNYSQGLASQQLGNYRNALAGMANMGQSAAVGAGSMGQQNANALGQLFAGQGQAQATGAFNQANAWGNALAGLSSAANQYAGQRQSSYTNQNTPFAVAGMGNGVAIGNNTYRGR